MMKLSALHGTLQELQAQFGEVSGWRVALTFAGEQVELAAARQAVAIADLSASGKISVEGGRAARVFDEAMAVDAGGLGIGEGLEAGPCQTYRLRQDQFFLRCDPGDEAELIEKLSASVPDPTGSGDLVTVTEVTHGWSELALIGPNSTELLSRLCGLDLGETSFPDLSARTSSVAKTRQLILRRDRGGIRAYSLIGDRSLAAYLWQTLLQAGKDLGIQPTGAHAIGGL